MCIKIDPEKLSLFNAQIMPFKFTLKIGSVNDTTLISSDLFFKRLIDDYYINRNNSII
jgi:hypothetical protein